MNKGGVLRMLWRKPTARISLLFLGFMAAAACFGPLFLPASAGMPGPLRYAEPSLAHPFGTDINGRDLLYRVLEGGRISLLVGLAGALVSMSIGLAYGMIAGYAAGKIDAVMMRIVDILYSVPRLIFILIFLNAFNDHVRDFASAVGVGWLAESSRIVLLIVSLGLIEWLTMARIVRGQVLSLKTRTFVTAARALGQTHFQIIVRHLLPNLIGIAVVYLTLTIPAVIIDESFLSFLGVGVQAPLASWGLLLADGASAINPVRSHWWLLVFPALAMASTLLALNFAGDALRDALDPKGRS